MSIKFAVVVNGTVAHLYYHRIEAESCQHAYEAATGQSALVAELEPPLAPVRRRVRWGALDDRGALRTSEVAVGGPGLRPLRAPIRAAMPVHSGVPQFAPP